VFKAIVLHHHPADADAFDAYFLGVHMPMARTVPGLIRDEVTVLRPTPDGAAPPYHIVTALYYEDYEAFEAWNSSPGGQALAADVHNFPGLVKHPILLVGSIAGASEAHT
jgi:uncharacterized protein (TIGR02118 family)